MGFLSAQAAKLNAHAELRVRELMLECQHPERHYKLQCASRIDPLMFLKSYDKKKDLDLWILRAKFLSSVLKAG